MLRYPESFETIGCESVGWQQHPGGANRSLHYSASCGQWLTTQIFALMKKTVKDGIYGFAFLLLKELESGNLLLIKHNNLAIKKEGGGFKDPYGGCNLRKTVRAIFFIPRQQSHPILFFVGKDPIAVVFLLVDPSGPVEWFGNERGKHGLNTKWDAILQYLSVSSQVFAPAS